MKTILKEAKNGKFAIKKTVAITKMSSVSVTETKNNQDRCMW